jgi:hypothetical protein
MKVKYLADQEGLFIPIYKELKPTGKWCIDSNGLLHIEHKTFFGLWSVWIPENLIVI